MPGEKGKAGQRREEVLDAGSLPAAGFFLRSARAVHEWSRVSSRERVLS